MPAEKVGWVTPHSSAALLKFRSLGERKQEFQFVDH